MPRPGPRRVPASTRILPEASDLINTMAAAAGITRAGMIRQLLSEAITARTARLVTPLQATARPDPAGGEVSGFEVIRKARKVHRCERCGGSIQPGETYRRYSLHPNSDIGNAHWWAASECAPCCASLGRPLIQSGVTP